MSELAWSKDKDAAKPELPHALPIIGASRSEPSADAPPPAAESMSDPEQTEVAQTDVAQAGLQNDAEAEAYGNMLMPEDLDDAVAADAPGTDVESGVAPDNSPEANAPPADEVAPAALRDQETETEDGFKITLQPKEPAESAPADAPNADPQFGAQAEDGQSEPQAIVDGGANAPLNALGADEPLEEPREAPEQDAAGQEISGTEAEVSSQLDAPQGSPADEVPVIDGIERDIESAPAAAAPETDAKADDSNITKLVINNPASGWFAVEPDAVIRGWTMDRTNLDCKLAVTILIDDVAVGTAMADRRHLRLVERGEGDGHYAFAFAVPPQFYDGAVHTVAAELCTEGYEGKRLKINKADFSLPPDTELPRFLLQRATPDFLEGTLINTHPDWNGEMDVWLDGVRLPQDSVMTEQLGSGDSKASLRIRLHDYRPLELLSRSVVISYPGVQETLHEEGAMQGLLQAEVRSIGEGHFAAILGEGLAIPSGLELLATLADEQGQIQEQFSVRFYDNIGEFRVADTNEHELLTLSLMTFDDIVLATNIAFAINSKRRLLTNGTFEHWQADAPRDWVPSLTADAERSFYAFPANLKSQYGLSGKTLILKLTPGSSEQPVLSQHLRRTSRFGLTATDITIAFMARVSRQIELEFRLVEESGAVVASTRFITGSRWKLGSRSVTVSRPEATPSPLTFEILAHFLPSEDNLYLEIAGLRCGDLDEEVFDVPPVPQRSAAQLRRGVNLLVNPDLQSWPSGLSFSDRRSRFEIAEGWYLFNRRATAVTKASAISVPGIAGGTPRYGLSLDITAVPEYCRLEIALDTAEMYGAAQLQFTASCNEISEGSGSRFQFEKQWAQIDKIYILKRETVTAGQKVAQVDSTIATVTRRVLLAREWESLSYNFILDAAEQAGEFEPVTVDEKLVEYFLVFEIKRPIQFSIHSVDLQFITPSDAANAPPLLQLEDRNIRAQVGAIKGLGAWISPSIARSGLVPPPLAGDGQELERWNWKHNALGTVDIGICVYNATDETLACLASLVGSTSVPHTVRIVNDGSDEDCRQRILQFIADKPWMKLIDNGANRGYTASANRVVLGSDADWVILLNSDTIVSKGWIEGLLEVAATDPKIALVGPVSNAATYQSVPELYDGGGKWAVNDLPEGWTPADLAAVVAERSLRDFPEVPLLNGFCTLIRRGVFAEIGGLNEAAFPAGYGEENDMCVRAIKAGYRLCVADHVYVYHTKSASFGSARRLELAKAGDKTLRAMHHEIDFSAMGRRFMETPALTHLRQAVRMAYKGQKN